MKSTVYLPPSNQRATGQNGNLLTLLLWSFLCLALLLLVIYAVLSGPKGTPVSEPVIATEDPVQTLLPATDPIIWHDEESTWHIIPRATYRMAARVIKRKRYSDEESSLIPWDLALGWGQISEPQMDEWISWSQSNRSLSAEWIGPLPLPFPEDYVRDHAANVHIIPATNNLLRALASLKVNDLVLLEGILVDVEGGRVDEPKVFRTSLTRSDLAPGGCELFYVERLVVDAREYR